MKYRTLNIVILSMLIYWFTLSFFSSDLLRSYQFYFKQIVPFLVFLISYNSVFKRDTFHHIAQSFMLILIVGVLFAVISSLFGIGDNSYSRRVENYVSIGLGDGKLYAPAIAIVYLQIFLKHHVTKKNIKYLINILTFIGIVYLLFSLRRTTILILVFGIGVYYLFEGNLKRISTILIRSSFLLLLTSGFWLNQLTERISMRQSKFEKSYSISDESRYKEFAIVFSEAHNSESISTILFGKELFNSPGNYAGGLYKHRMLHTDFTRIFHGSGYIGLLIYLTIFLVIFSDFKKALRRKFLINSNNNLISLKETKGLFMSFLLLVLLISFSGQMYEITFRTMLFWVIGSVLSFVKSHE